jgi:hypothetical protein
VKADPEERRMARVIMLTHPHRLPGIPARASPIRA